MHLAVRLAAISLVLCTVRLAVAADTTAQKTDDAGHRIITYKSPPQGELKLELFFPNDWKPSDHRPAIVFFFGGGWTSGSRNQFVPECQYFASRGMVAATADYRIRSKHHTTPDLCVEDAKSAVRYLRQHASELGIDPNRLAAGGGSAGGHLAAATATLPKYDAPGEDTAISCVPDALVLFNPALNLTNGVALAHMPGGGEARATLAHDLTPNLYITPKTPPAIIFFGTDDQLGAGGREFIEKSSITHNRAELYLAEGMKHGFFNKSPWLEATMRQADEFLISLGYLEGKPTIQANAAATLKRAEENRAPK